MTTNQKPPEKRNNPRYMARIAIFNGPYQKELLTEYSINMSAGGVFMETIKVLPVDTELIVKFNLPNSDIIIVSRARVAWTNDRDSIKKASLPLGMGLQFLDLSFENMNIIRTFLDKGEFVPTW